MPLIKNTSRSGRKVIEVVAENVSATPGLFIMFIDKKGVQSGPGYYSKFTEKMAYYLDEDEAYDYEDFDYFGYQLKNDKSKVIVFPNPFR